MIEDVEKVDVVGVDLDDEFEVGEDLVVELVIEGFEALEVEERVLIDKVIGLGKVDVVEALLVVDALVFVAEEVVCEELGSMLEDVE